MRIGFIGATGVPNRYGGFESFLEACAPVMAADHEVYVTCDASRYDDFAPQWSGVHRLFLKTSANGGASIAHDMLAFCRVVLRVDAVVVLGVSAGIAFPLMRLICAMLGKALVVNVDGVEWRRAKFGRLKRAFLRASDTLAQFAAHRVVVDNAALFPFLTAAGRRKATCIAYSGDQVLRLADTGRQDGILTICRIEPENNCHLLLEAVATGDTGQTYEFIGNWAASAYGRALRARYAGVQHVRLHDAMYDERVVATYRERCAVYLHGHGVGGTNPSLVEMLFYDCRILAFDCPFNRETAGDAAEYFRDVDTLRALLGRADVRPDPGRAVVRARYSRTRIAEQYLDVIKAALAR